jgi:hypothetical protein
MHPAECFVFAVAREDRLPKRQISAAACASLL